MLCSASSITLSIISSWHKVQTTGNTDHSASVKPLRNFNEVYAWRSLGAVASIACVNIV